MFYVYSLENVESNKYYFGYTDLNPEKISHAKLLEFASKNADLKHLYNSMKKYGLESFCMEIRGKYSEEENAIHSMLNHIKKTKSSDSLHGYNYKSAQLIPTVEELQPEVASVPNNQGSICASEEPYSLFDVIITCTKCLSDMKDCFEKSEFTDFMIAYDAYNRYIPITGILNNFCLSQSAIMFQLLRVCKDALGVYIKEHEILK